VRDLFAGRRVDLPSRQIVCGRSAKDSWVVVDRLCNRESSYPADRPVNGPQGPQGDLGGLGCQM
jgi:hypothetical protein